MLKWNYVHSQGICINSFTTGERLWRRRQYCQGLKTRYCRVGLLQTAQPVKILALDTFCRSLNKQNKVRLFFLDQRPHQVQEFDSPGCLLWARWAVPYFAALASFRNSLLPKAVLLHSWNLKPSILVQLTAVISLFIIIFLLKYLTEGTLSADPFFQHNSSGSKRFLPNLVFLPFITTSTSISV